MSEEKKTNTKEMLKKYQETKKFKQNNYDSIVYNK